MAEECKCEEMKTEISPRVWQNAEGETIAQGIKMRISCPRCGSFFRFRCFPVDDTGMNPVMSLDGTEVHIPVDEPWTENEDGPTIEVAH